MPARKLLKLKFNWLCREGFNNAGLFELKPASLVKYEALTPPEAVSTGLDGSFRKLNMVLPPSVCAPAWKKFTRKMIKK